MYVFKLTPQCDLRLLSFVLSMTNRDRYLSGGVFAGKEPFEYSHTFWCLHHVSEDASGTLIIVVAATKPESHLVVMAVYTDRCLINVKFAG